MGVVLESDAGELSICGIFCVAAIATSAYHVYGQLSNFSNPAHQTHIVRILLMVPVYALGGWCSLAFRHQEIYFDTIKVLIIHPPVMSVDLCLFWLRLFRNEQAKFHSTALFILSLCRFTGALKQIEKSRSPPCCSLLGLL